MVPTRQKINLREERDLGETLNTTFAFIRSNFRVLLKTLFLYVSPVALASGIFSGLYQARLMQSLTDDKPYSTFGEYNFFHQISSVHYYLSVLFTIISVFVLFQAIYSFMVIYQDEEGEVSPTAVWHHMKENLVQVIYSGIGISLVTVLSIFLFGLGIYLSVAFSLFVIVMVREELGFVETIERCFYLIKGNWWATLGLILVIGLIQGCIGWLAALPVGIITIFRIFEIPGMDSSMLLIGANVFASVLGIYIYALSAVAIGLQYFNLVEKKDGIGLLEQADLIGNANVQARANEGHY